MVQCTVLAAAGAVFTLRLMHAIYMLTGSASCHTGLLHDNQPHLPPLQDCLEGHDASAGLHGLKSLSILGLQAAVSMPAAKQVVCHERQGGGNHEGAANPECVCCTPD
jgi:hypothetical protein